VGRLEPEVDADLLELLAHDLGRRLQRAALAGTLIDDTDREARRAAFGGIAGFVEEFLRLLDVAGEFQDIVGIEGVRRRDRAGRRLAAAVEGELDEKAPVD